MPSAARRRDELARVPERDAGRERRDVDREHRSRPPASAARRSASRSAGTPRSARRAAARDPSQRTARDEIAHLQRREIAPEADRSTADGDRRGLLGHDDDERVGLLAQAERRAVARAERAIDERASATAAGCIPRR